MGRMRVGPLGGLREVESFPDRKVTTERPEASFVTLGGRRVIQRSARAARSWEQSWRLSSASDVAYLTACADGSIPGPLYLHTQDAALTNLLPSDVAAPGRMGTVALGSVAGTVPVGMAEGVVPMSGVVQQASAGAWSPIIPVRQVSHTLSAWASAAGSALSWRTVNAAGAQVATGMLTAAAVTGGFRASATFTPGATAAGVQVCTPAGSLVVGGLRLTEGAHDPVWLPGVGVPQVVVGDPQQTLQLATATEVRSDYTVTLREVG